ncbi:hypothetical protein FZC76_06985 [Sutcliffiella horikoshii]|uniref:Uncharacterized protein n=1 Tax=Sutcliffiella horikoshii TaxID=79883 RepID=A0A5D4T3F9_9BACI|nr:hypothetical protein [Sutcliffiella horikoshii]TYS68684.1 hypothetical protein FZC76_06985 [Sutcliffiella horikoshii]
MTHQITNQHLQFVGKAKDAFQNNPLLETYRDHPRSEMIALRMGADRDCVHVFELGDEVANFVQQMDPQPGPRKEVREFAQAMEIMLALNEQKGHWKNEHWQFLKRELSKNYHRLVTELLKEDHDKYEITLRCANIANFAMMISDNYGGGRL